jgi:hypothetical protein
MTAANIWLRRLPLIAGGLGGLLLLVNRWLTSDPLPSQSRSDALGILLSALLLLTGLLWQQAQPLRPDAVVLEGEAGFVLDETLPDPLRQELAWASKLLLTNTITGSVVLWLGTGTGTANRTLLRRGVLGPKATVTPGPILKRVLQTGKPVYLVDLKLYPGRIEFDYLPPNTQGVICQPVGQQGVLILGAKAPRSYTAQDEAWIAGLAEKLSVCLADLTPTGNPEPQPQR